METTRYDELRTLVAANFSETTQRLVDEALAYAAECLEKQVRYDGSPLLDHAAGVARIVISEIGLGRNSTLAAILHDVVRLPPPPAAYPQWHFAQRDATLSCALCTTLFVIFLLQLQILRPKRQFMQILCRKAPFLLQ